MTYDELLDAIRTFPGNLPEGPDGTAVPDVVAAAKIARATQESLTMRVEIARGRGATWEMIGNAIGITPSRAEQRYLERRPFGARW